MALADLPFVPIRSHLYRSRELTEGFVADQPESYAETLDFRIYRYFMKNGGATPADPLASMMEALHDNCISQAVAAMLRDCKPVAAIMGGHKMDRGSLPYRQVATIASGLAQQGFLLASGGGPGAMEATHLGALLSKSGDAALEAALARLGDRTIAALPETKDLVRKDGTFDRERARALQAWYRPALEIRDATSNPGTSLAIPTWHYGHEPFTPLATHIAKYFQNSIREDGLLALALDGVVYVEGKAGTIQEIFQDAAQNYYTSVGDRFSPMVFLGEEYWTKKYPVRALIQALYEQNDRGEDFRRYVLFSDDVGEVVAFLCDHVARRGVAAGP